jgi:beta-mannosidase
MDLSGTWRAALADDDLRRDAVQPEFDDDGWEPIAVPGHWRSTPAFSTSDGPLIYRTRFELDAGPPDARHWLVLDGIFYQGDVWLDGAYLGDPEGYFFPHAYDITDLAGLASEHALFIEVTCSPQRDKRRKRNITGVFQHWDCIDPDWNPGGLWRPVRVERTGPVRITRLRLICHEANEDRAVLQIHAELDSADSRTVRIRTMVDDRVEREHSHLLAKGANEVNWQFGIDNPDLWWPWMLGRQALTTLAVTVFADDEVSDRRTVRTGLRQAAMRHWTLTINGERLFAKGANLAPTRRELAEATPEELRRDVVLAKDAGLDLIRLHAHVSRRELYDAADELGMIVWQDFPLQWGYARSIRHQATRQAREMVDLLGHHPSIAVWCGHNEPLKIGVEPGQPFELKELYATYAAGQLLPSWNRSFLDLRVKRAIDKADGSRPVVPHSGVLPHPPRFDGTDSHLYFGWYWGDERGLPGFAAAAPRMVRFVGEFGAQAVPESADFMDPEQWPRLPWDQLGRHHALQRHLLDERVMPLEFADFADWRAATQRYQARVLKHHVEHLRRLKYRPTGGFAMFLLNDAQPAVSWSVLDHRREAKLGYHALTEACRPVIIVADRLPERVEPGSALALDVHVVNDLRRSITDADVSARLSWPGGAHSWRWRGDVGADGVARVGIVRFVVPDALGPLALDLDFVGGDVAATNRYEGEIALTMPYRSSR